MCMKNVNMTIAFGDVAINKESDSVSIVNFGKVFRIEKMSDGTRKIPLISLAVFISASQSKQFGIQKEINDNEYVDLIKNITVKRVFED